MKLTKEQKECTFVLVVNKVWITEVIDMEIKTKMKNKEYTHYTILKETENKISQPILIKQLSVHFSFNYIRDQIAFLVKNEFIEREKINNRTFNLKITRKGKALRHALRIKLSLLNGVK